MVVASFVLAATLVSPGARAQSEAPPFADVPSDAYYHEPVLRLAEMGVFEGTECEEGFCPGQPLLRREMAVWLIRALGEDGDLTDNDSRFADVEDGDWHIPYIERMADLKITVGCRSDPPPRFCPDQAVSRGQMASFLARALDLPAAPSAGFADVSRDNVHAANIDKLAASKITVGCRVEPLRYCPESSTTRAHMATFIHRALKWREERNASRIVEDENPGVFLTEENELSRFVKHEIVDKYADEHPWLMEVWNYTNRPDFAYSGYSSAQTYYGWAPHNPDAPALTGIKAVALSMEAESLGYSSSWPTAAHELAHVYTQATDGANSYPAPVGVAHLYFAHLANTKCPSDPNVTLGSELFADALMALIDWHKHPQVGEKDARPTYWLWCQLEFTQEAEGVTTSVLQGGMPQWLYDTFQMPDGSLDYKAIWAAVKDVPYYNRFRVVYQLKDAFGGYCSDRAANQSAFGNSNLQQPWRDGGC